MTSKIYFIFALTLVTACNSEKSVPDEQLNWKTLKNGNKISIDFSKTLAWKCKQKSNRFMCIWIASNNNIDSDYHTFYSMNSINVIKLPDSYAMDHPSDRVGYFCNYKILNDSSLEIYQAITLDAETVDSRNSTSTLLVFDAADDSSATPWGKEYVKNFISRNKIESQDPYFDCLEIGGALSSGSLKTLETDLIE